MRSRIASISEESIFEVLCVDNSGSSRWLAGHLLGDFQELLAKPIERCENSSDLYFFEIIPDIVEETKAFLAGLHEADRRASVYSRYLVASAAVSLFHEKQ